MDQETNYIVGHEVEAKIANFHAKNGQVLFGGKLASELEGITTAVPDNLGMYTNRQIGGGPGSA